MKSFISTILFLLFLTITSQTQVDAGIIRLNTLRNRSLSNQSRIINLTNKDFNQFVMKYPRPYDVVIYFYAKQVRLSQQLFKQYNYTVQLYSLQGAIDSQVNPTFFARIDFSKQTQKIFKYFAFDSAPNLVVSKPHMAVVGDFERQSYLKDFKWRISHTDGVVTTQKMLDFLNKRTQKSIAYKPTQETIKYILLIFAAVSLSGVIIYKLFKPIWTHWLFWFIISMLIYLVCMTGIVHCILDDSINQDLKQTGKITFFRQGGGRDQGFYQGCLISGIISFTGIVLIIIAVSGQKLKGRYSAIVGIVGIIVVCYSIGYIERVYGVKSWYGPSYRPPGGYLKGPLNVDQGNNI